MANLAVLYRENMTALAEALEGGNARVMRERVRSLMEEVRLVPDEGSLRVEIKGKLASILGLASWTSSSDKDLPDVASATLALQIKMVAETRNYLDLLLNG